MADRRLALALLALLAVPLAGCAGGGDAAQTGGLSGRAQQTVQGTNGGSGGAGNSTGLIEGRVADEANATLAGASVSLLGTSQFAVTDKHGGFRLAGVAPGQRTLRIVATGYSAFETDVAVQAARVTRVDITLIPADSRGPGYRPHIHDFWGKDTEVALMDADVDLSQRPAWVTTPEAVYSSEAVAVSPNNNFTFQFAVPTERTDGRPPIVLPYTRALRITLTWDTSQVDVAGFGVQYITAASYLAHNTAVRAAGQPFDIPLAAGEADNGHQAFTLWRFGVYTGNQYSQQGFKPETIRGPVHVKILLLKGEVTSDPPHADWWKGNASLVLRSFGTTYTTTSVSVCYEQQTYMLLLDEKRIVPPGTARLHLKFSWALSDYGGTPADGDWSLKWRSADMDPSATRPADFKTQAPSATPSPGIKEYDLTLTPAQTDAFYQVKTNWVFDAYNPLTADKNVCATDTHHTFHLEITAFKDPTFA